MGEPHPPSTLGFLPYTAAGAILLAATLAAMNFHSRESIFRSAVREAIPPTVQIRDAAGPTLWPLSQNDWVSFRIPKEDLDSILDREGYVRDERANLDYSGSRLNPPPWWPSRVVASDEVAVYKREDDPSSADKSRWSAIIVYMERTSECFAMKSYNW